MRQVVQADNHDTICGSGTGTVSAGGRKANSDVTIVVWSLTGPVVVGLKLSIRIIFALHKAVQFRIWPQRRQDSKGQKQ